MTTEETPELLSRLTEIVEQSRMRRDKKSAPVDHRRRHEPASEANHARATYQRRTQSRG